MPIVRTYACTACLHMMEVTLAAEAWDAEPPECPACAARTHQEFKPIALGGSNHARAHAIAEDIVRNDYRVADMQGGGREGDTQKVRYQDQAPGVMPSTWGTNLAMLQQAVASGRQTRLEHGNGLDVLQSTLKSGAQPDLIAASRRRAMKVW